MGDAEVFMAGLAKEVYFLNKNFLALIKSKMACITLAYKVMH